MQYTKRVYAKKPRTFCQHTTCPNRAPCDKCMCKQTFAMSAYFIASPPVYLCAGAYVFDIRAGV